MLSTYGVVGVGALGRRELFMRANRPIAVVMAGSLWATACVGGGATPSTDPGDAGGGGGGDLQRPVGEDPGATRTAAPDDQDDGLDAIQIDVVVDAVTTDESMAPDDATSTGGEDPAVAFNVREIVTSADDWATLGQAHGFDPARHIDRQQTGLVYRYPDLGDCGRQLDALFADDTELVTLLVTPTRPECQPLGDDWGERIRIVAIDHDDTHDWTVHRLATRIDTSTDITLAPGVLHTHDTHPSEHLDAHTLDEQTYPMPDIEAPWAVAERLRTPPHGAWAARSDIELHQRLDRPALADNADMRDVDLPDGRVALGFTTYNHTACPDPDINLRRAADVVHIDVTHDTTCTTGDPTVTEHIWSIPVIEEERATWGIALHRNIEPDWLGEPDVVWAAITPALGTATTAGARDGRLHPSSR